VIGFSPNNTMNITIRQKNTAQSIPITVQTDKKTYRLGDFVETSGTVNNMNEETL